MAKRAIKTIIESYMSAVLGASAEVARNQDRASGGVIRASKGRLVEGICELMIKQAWADIKGAPARLKFVNRKERITVRIENLDGLPSFIQRRVKIDQNSVFYRAGVDRHVYIDDKFVMGVECKAYTENAMLKRILVDFYLLKLLYPELICTLLQLETFLGGENPIPSADSPVAGDSTYTLMSHFPSVNLRILTLLEGSREVTRPIHEPEYFKNMKPEFVQYAIDCYGDLLKPFA